jgi:hypothetical protein
MSNAELDAYISELIDQQFANMIEKRHLEPLPVAPQVAQN